VARAQGGDQQAFAELVCRYSALVFRLAVSILGWEFIPEAEDVAQEVFLKVHHAIASFRGEAEFSSWIYRIAFNQAVNLKARVRFRSPHVDEAVLHRTVSPGPGPYRQAETAQRDRALAECIQTLPEVYQSALRTTVLLAWRRRSRSGGVDWRSREYCQIVSASRAPATAWHAEGERIFL